ncbi:hypothetical protein SDC9_118175 [bioreactor metagenome]|uniref:Uncharacterized protein n=1 Tax=bioreactor metagenome TaxID=1076179 RepID=A0A645C0S9_9ZZZZ
MKLPFPHRHKAFTLRPGGQDLQSGGPANKAVRQRHTRLKRPAVRFLQTPVHSGIVHLVNVVFGGKQAVGNLPVVRQE